LVVGRGALSSHALASDGFNTFDIGFAGPVKLVISNRNTVR
jgi:hypothetical protein